MTAQSPELQAKIARWRQMSVEGSMTQADYIEAIRFLRADRMSASIASEKSRTKKAKAEVQSAQTLLDELGDL